MIKDPNKIAAKLAALYAQRAHINVMIRKACAQHTRINTLIAKWEQRLKDMCDPKDEKEVR